MNASPFKKVTLLVGNGMSIAFDRGLMLNLICRRVYDAIVQSGTSGDVIAATMRDIAARSNTGDPQSDFEIFVGSFGSEGTTLAHLESLAKLVAPNDKKVAAALREAAQFARSISVTGTHAVLRDISLHSAATWDKKAGLNAFFDEVLSSFGGEIVVANLNYDSLVLSTLSERHKCEFSDQGDGRAPIDILMPNGVGYTAFELREHLDFYNRVHLVQLHGSLTFWRLPDGRMVKLPVDAVRSQSFWDALKADPSIAEPLVVLASQRDKPGLVAGEPFSLAYREFVRGLDGCSDWLIVGFSFRDKCVNDRLADAFRRKVTPPTVLVSTYGNELSRKDVEAAFGWDTTTLGYADWLTIHRAGVDDLITSTEWRQFKFGSGGRRSLAS